MPSNQIQVGIQNNPDSSTLITQRGGKQGDAIVSELHGRYYEQASRGNIFSGAVVGVTTSVGLATTYTGLCLTNPLGSGVNVVLNKVGYSFIVAFTAGAAIGIATGFHPSTAVAHTTPVTPRSQLFIGAASTGRALLDSAATLPAAPTVNTIFASGLTGAITTLPHVANSIVDLEGAVILVPGAFAILYTSTASGAAALSASFSWEEVPV
jgi:hypothetical protein